MLDNALAIFDMTAWRRGREFRIKAVDLFAATGHCAPKHPSLVVDKLAARAGRLPLEADRAANAPCL